MRIDFLIIGQGISGTFLSYYLHKEGKTIKVIDSTNPRSPSRVAAGIINPVTGRRMVKVWMADQILPFARDAYHEIGEALGIEAISQKTIIDFFPGPFQRESFLNRMNEDGEYLHAYPEQNQFNEHFNYEFGCGEVRPAFTAHLETLLPAWRARLESGGLLLDEVYDHDLLSIEEELVRYKDIEAGAIIFCDGSGGFDNPLFRMLPFSPNKGEALLLEIPGLPNHHIFKRSMTLVPLAGRDQFWIGSTYQWEFPDDQPTPAFRHQATSLLQSWLKLPFRITGHIASIRPATIERRPFVGMHPLHKNTGILNGMGTKGCSLAPYFARQLTDHLLYNMEIQAEANVSRFRKVLETH